MIFNPKKGEKKKKKSGSLDSLAVDGINYCELFIFPMAPQRPLSIPENVVYNW
jgi:hypothetical protein